jgi:hypothetical protein
MDYIYFILKVIAILVIVILFTRLLMGAANYLGKEFGIGDFVFKFISKGMKSNSEKR